MFVKHSLQLGEVRAKERHRRVLMRKKSLANRITATRDANLKVTLTDKVQSLEGLVASHGKEKRYAELKEVEVVKGNQKFLYKYAQKKAKISFSIGPLNVDGELAEDPERICEILRSQYDSGSCFQ